MGLDLRSALEIYSNPTDLEFVLLEKSGQWGFMISRGPGHNCKIIVSTQLYQDNSDAVIADITTTLNAICEKCAAELEDKTSIAAQILNPEDRPLEEATNTLTSDLIDWICDELKKNQVACTHKRALQPG